MAAAWSKDQGKQEAGPSQEPATDIQMRDVKCQSHSQGARRARAEFRATQEVTLIDSVIRPGAKAGDGDG